MGHPPMRVHMGGTALAIVVCVASVLTGWILFATSGCGRLAVEFACVQGGVFVALALWHLARADASADKGLAHAPAVLFAAGSVCYAIWLLVDRVPLWDLAEAAPCRKNAAGASAVVLTSGALITSSIVVHAILASSAALCCPERQGALRGYRIADEATDDHAA